MINVTITGKLVGLDVAKQSFKTGKNKETNREWKMINIGVNFYNQFTRKIVKKFFTVWGNDAEDIKNFAFEGQEIEISGYLAPRQDERTGVWKDEIRVSRSSLGLPLGETINVPPMPKEFIPPTAQVPQVEPKEKELDDSILWD